MLILWTLTCFHHILNYEPSTFHWWCWMSNKNKEQTLTSHKICRFIGRYFFVMFCSASSFLGATYLISSLKWMTLHWNGHASFNFPSTDKKHNLLVKLASPDCGELWELTRTLNVSLGFGMTNVRLTPASHTRPWILPSASVCVTGQRTKVGTIKHLQPLSRYELLSVERDLNRKQL